MRRCPVCEREKQDDGCNVCGWTERRDAPATPGMLANAALARGWRNAAPVGDLTTSEFCELSCFMPNLACVLDREPPRMVEETRRAARREVALLLREMVRLRMSGIKTGEGSRR